jgi:hypothetical protein
MTSKKTTTTSTTSRPTCGYPGCDQPAAQPGGPGRPPEYCAGRGHTRASAWKECRRLAAEKYGTTISAADDASPVTMAKVTGSELLRSLRAEADRISALGRDLRERIDVLTDPTAAEAEVEAVRAAAEQRAATAEAKAADAECRAAQADQFRTETDDAAEQMSEELTAAQARASAAELRAQAAEADRDAAVAKAQADAEARIAAVVAERDAAIVQAQADADAKVRAAEADRDEARNKAAGAETAAVEARQDTARAETERVRTDAGRMLGEARADAAREREELRADLRARAEVMAEVGPAARAILTVIRLVALLVGTGVGLSFSRDGDGARGAASIAPQPGDTGYGCRGEQGDQQERDRVGGLRGSVSERPAQGRADAQCHGGSRHADACRQLLDSRGQRVGVGHLPLGNVAEAQGVVRGHAHRAGGPADDRDDDDHRHGRLPRDERGGADRGRERRTRDQEDRAEAPAVEDVGCRGLDADVPDEHEQHDRP